MGFELPEIQTIADCSSNLYLNAILKILRDAFNSYWLDENS